MMLSLVLSIVFLGSLTYSIAELILLLRIVTGVYRYDHFEKKKVTDTLAMSMLVILIINLGQLLLSFKLPVDFPGFISPGGFHNGGLIPMLHCILIVSCLIVQFSGYVMGLAAVVLDS